MKKLKRQERDPENVTSLDLSLHSTSKTFENYNYDVSDISDLIGDLSIFNNLETLKLTAFPVSDKLLNSIWSNKKIRYLIFWNVELSEIPKGIRALPALESLLLQYEAKIKTIPSWIGELTNLKVLGLYGCEKLESLPLEISNLRNLEHLVLGENRKLKEVAINIKKLTNLDKESKQGLRRLIKKIEKEKHKIENVKSGEAEKYFSKFDNKPCVISYESQDWQGVVFNWKHLDTTQKLFISDELGDELCANKNLLPFGVFSFIEEDINYTNFEEYLVGTEQPELYLMINQESKKIFESGCGETTITINELNIRLRNIDNK